MKKLLLLLLLIPFLGTSQGTFTAPVGYNTGVPTAAPSGVGTRWRFDLLTGKKYTWNPDAAAWDEDPRGIDQISGCSAPMYTPGYNQSTFAVNSCSPTPELYQYTGSSWVKLNGGGSYTAGANIDITGNVISLTGNLPIQRFNAGTNAASNTYWRGDGLWAGLPGFLTSLNGLSPAIQTFATSTSGTDFSIQSFGSTHTFRLPTASATNRGALSSADWSTFNSKDPSSTNEIQTLSIAGQDLTLSGGGGTVAIPAGTDGNGIYSGNGTTPPVTAVEITDYLGFGHSVPVGWESGLSFDYTSIYDYVRLTGGQFGFRSQNDGGQSIDFLLDVAGGFNSTFVEGTKTGVFSGGVNGGQISSSNSDGSERAFIIGANFSEGELSVSDPTNRGNGKFKAERGRSTMSVFKDGVNVELFLDPDDGSFLGSDAPGFLGLQYAAYYPDIETSAQSFTDVQTVNSLKQKLVLYTESERDAISSPATGYIIFCADCTANDTSTGVTQVFNGTIWKNLY